MAKKVSLHDQIRAVERGEWEAVRLFASEFYAQYPHMVRFEAEHLAAAAATLRFMLRHEQTIRDAISSARTVDDPQDTR